MKSRYVILHLNFPVASVVFDDKYSILKIEKVYDKERLPIGLYTKQLNVSDLNEWLFSRAIPQKRTGLKFILEATNTSSNKELLIKNLGLGLTDNYWIKPEKLDLSWEKVNFFENNFSEVVNSVYLKHSSKKDIAIDADKLTPNNASSGMLPKGWICKSNKRYMIKGSELLNYQEPYNEVIISRWLNGLGVDHVKYKLKLIEKRPYSICENMLGKDEELIHACYVSNLLKRDNKKSYLDHYINCCKELGLDDSIRRALDNMIIIDYISANIDRHWSNFGIIRDSITLRVKRLAPLYDNGAALFAKIPTLDIKIENKDLKCQSFNSKQTGNIKLVTNFDILENPSIHNLIDISAEEFTKNIHMDNKRKNEIIFRIKQRIKTARKIK